MWTKSTYELLKRLFLPISRSMSFTSSMSTMSPTVIIWSWVSTGGMTSMQLWCQLDGRTSNNCWSLPMTIDRMLLRRDSSSVQLGCTGGTVELIECHRTLVEITGRTHIESDITISTRCTRSWFRLSTIMGFFQPEIHNISTSLCAIVSMNGNILPVDNTANSYQGR